MSNRHGLIAGATGTGKTISLKVLAEAFSSIGVSVFLADIKGDVASICNPRGGNPKIEEIIKVLDLNNFKYQGFPTLFWDVFGIQGHPVRTTISEMGPLLLSRLLGLNDVQSGISENQKLFSSLMKHIYYLPKHQKRSWIKLNRW